MENLCLLAESDNEAAQLKANELLGKHLMIFTDKIDHTHVVEGVKSIGWANCFETPCKEKIAYVLVINSSC